MNETHTTMSAQPANAVPRCQATLLIRWLATAVISILCKVSLIEFMFGRFAWASSAPTLSRNGVDQRLRQLDRLGAQLPRAPAEWLAASARLQIEIEELAAAPSAPETAAALSHRRQSLAALTEQIRDFRTRREELLALSACIQQRS